MKFYLGVLLILFSNAVLADGAERVTFFVKEYWCIDGTFSLSTEQAFLPSLPGPVQDCVLLAKQQMNADHYIKFDRAAEGPVGNFVDYVLDKELHVASRYKSQDLPMNQDTYNIQEVQCGDYRFITANEKRPDGPHLDSDTVDLTAGQCTYGALTEVTVDYAIGGVYQTDQSVEEFIKQKNWNK